MAEITPLKLTRFTQPQTHDVTGCQSAAVVQKELAPFEQYLHHKLFPYLVQQQKRIDTLEMQVQELRGLLLQSSSVEGTQVLLD